MLVPTFSLSHCPQHIYIPAGRQHIYIPASSLSSEKLILRKTTNRGSLGIPMAARTNSVSLPVVNVQALAETCNGFNDEIPERYIRTEASSEEVITGHGSTLRIPIIDLNRLLDLRSSSDECVKLVSACHNWGFFQLINHGVPDEVIENLMNDIAEFFKQPLEAKKAYSQLPNSLEGYEEQAFVVSDNQKLDWSDRFYLQVRPVESRDLSLWPRNPASFRHSVDIYSSEVAKLSCHLLEFMAKGMDAEPASLLGMFEGQPQGMRMNYYPPCWQADQVLGLLPHSDACGLTILLQTKDVHGLQVKKDGKWFAVNALDGTFIVNVGDTLEILSNGKFRSAEHRAVVNQNKERISVAIFHQPCQDLIVGPLPEFVKGDKVRYRSTSYHDFLTHYLEAKLDGKSHLEKLKL